MKSAQSWRSIGVSLVDQIDQLSVYEVNDWIRHWRTHNLPLSELSRALWHFVVSPRVRENADMLYERIDMGRALLSLNTSSCTTGWAVVTRLIQRALVMLGQKRIRNTLRTSGQGDLKTAWLTGSLRLAEWHTERQLRLSGPQSVLALTLPHGMPQPVLTFLPSLWQISVQLGQWWPPILEVPDFRLATRAQAQWVSSSHRVTPLVPKTESSGVRAWDPVKYVIDIIQSFPRSDIMTGNLFTCYTQDITGALLDQVARSTSGLSNRRLAALLIEVSAQLIQLTPTIHHHDQFSRHLLALTDWLGISRFACSEQDERLAIWGAWGWFLALSMAYLDPAEGTDTLSLTNLADPESYDEQDLWQALADHNEKDAIEVARKLGDVYQLWQAIEDEALVSLSPAGLRIIWAYKPWLSDKPFHSAWLPAVVRIMAQEPQGMTIHDGE
ncbi:hypothetical protein [Sulfobacillus thermosulfidooxidans]|uniref:hypothetical protein n=1 Tax=Sulfobacillus thermosulfidooxidans TaxID=28034 RepID=UPI00041A1F6A|nr:hypothetical protein [Sulfobacillus thermosulfidooxidans]